MNPYICTRVVLLYLTPKLISLSKTPLICTSQSSPQQFNFTPNQTKEMERSRAAVLFLLPLFSLLAIMLKVTALPVVSEECLMVYERGGVPAVAQSSECSHLVPSFKNQTNNCQSALFKGQSNYKQDRFVCNLNMVLPLAGDHGLEHFSIGVAALFDGENGEEVIEVASNLLLEYFWSHSLFVSYQAKIPDNDAKSLRYLLNSTSGLFPLNPNESRHMRSIKEALLRAICDIDSIFLEDEKENRFSRTMASVGVLFEDQLMVANIGRAKAILCSEKLDVHNGGTTPYLYAKELIEDREIDKERDILVAARAFEWTFWPSALLTLPRCIGISFMKWDGVLPEIDMTDWQPLTGEDHFLVIASRSIMKKVSPTEICDALLHSDRVCNSSNSTHNTSPAECVALMAFDRDNRFSVSNIVVPLSTIKSRESDL